MTKKLLFFIAFLNISYVGMSQCTYNGTGQAGGTVTPCIGATISSSTANAGQYIVVDVVKGFSYTFTVGDAFGGGRDERLTIFNMSNVAVGAFSSGTNGTSVTWVATFNGQIKVLLTRDCGNGGQAGQAITTVVNSVGNTDDSQTTFGTDNWVGHVYNWTGGAPPGGSSSPAAPASTTPFSGAEYVGYYNVPTETFNEGFGGDNVCFPVTSAGAIRNTINTETFAVRYRMRTSKSGCYLVTFRGDDGVRLYVDNVLVFSQWQEQGPTVYSNVLVNLSVNSNIVFDYYENGGQNVAEFSMTPFSASSNSVSPASALVCSGNSTLLDGSAYTYSGATVNPSLGYQWQSSTDNVTFTDISGATGEDYTPPAQTTSSSPVIRYYRRVVRATASGASACTFNSASVMVTTTVVGSISLSSAAGTNAQTRCTNSPITNITYTTTNASGATFSGLPAGVSGSWASNTATISGASTAAGTFNYTVTLTGSCNVVTASGTITVSSSKAPVVPALTNQVVCNAATNAATPLVLTGTVCGVVDENQSLTLTAPQSAVFTAVNFASYGTPTGSCGSLALSSCHATNSTSIVSTAALTLNTVTIAASNGVFGDPCAGTFKKLGVVLAYSNTAATYTWTNNTPSIGLAASGTGNVPSFTAVNNTAAPIIATISVTGTQGSCGSVVSTYTITVNPTNTITLTSAAATTAQNGCVSTPITSITYATTGATGATFTGLPSGVTGNWASNVATISGAPTVSGTFNYTVTSTGGCGSVSTGGSLVVNAATVGGSVSGGSTICNGGTSGLLTLSGHIGSVVRWESSIDNFTTSTPITNTTTTYTSGVLTQSTQFRAVIQNANCTIVNSAPTTVTVGGVSTWNGTSWDTAPTLGRSAIFAGNYSSAAALQVCSCTVNTTRNVTVLSGGSMTVQDFVNVTGSGTLTFENNAPLVQINNAAVNSGSVTVKRNSSALKRLDYTLWSSPVTGLQTLLNFSPLTFNSGPSNIRFYTYNTSANFYGIVPPNTAKFDLGKGYLIRMPNNHPTTATVWNGTFFGTPNNGLLTAPISYVSATQLYNTIGNPYPSPINMTAFVSANSANINGTLRFWRKTNTNTSNTGYSTWNGGIFVGGPNFNTSANPNNIIQTGQGFMVEAKAGATAVVFNNSMRLVDTANQFFKSSTANKNTIETPELDFVWLNLLATADVSSQTAVGYRASASNEVDEFDAEQFNDGQIAISSLIGSKGFVIQSRSPLAVQQQADVIPLQVKAPYTGTFIIEMDRAEGQLYDANTTIYLKDKANSVLVDLKQSGYSFIAQAGTTNDRFELLINKKGNETINTQSSSFAVYKDATEFVLQSGVQSIFAVKVYDLLGRLLFEKKNLNTKELRFDAASSDKVLIIKTTFTNGEEAVKKVIN